MEDWVVDKEFKVKRAGTFRPVPIDGLLIGYTSIKVF
jgi:hypothetical protein